jgi:hypothetical protein
MTYLRSSGSLVLRIGCGIPSLLAVLCLCAGMARQATISAGPPLLYEVKTIYIAPSPDELVLLIKSRLEKWSAVGITSKLEEADAILACQTETKIVPAKVVIRETTAIVTLVDRRSQRPIWRTSKSASFEISRLADEVVEQLKIDWRKSGREY